MENASVATVAEDPNSAAVGFMAGVKTLDANVPTSATPEMVYVWNHRRAADQLCGLRGSSTPSQSRALGRCSVDSARLAGRAGVACVTGTPGRASSRGAAAFSVLATMLAGLVGTTVLVLDHRLFGATGCAMMEAILSDLSTRMNEAAAQEQTLCEVCCKRRSIVRTVKS